MDGAIPNMSDTFGYDVPLSIRIKNLGAPMFEFGEDHMDVTFGLIWEIYKEDFSVKWAEIEMTDIYLDFDVWLERDEGAQIMRLNWNSIILEKAKVRSDFIKTLAETHADQHV
jgi:hypothetical protein